MELQFGCSQGITCHTLLHSVLLPGPTSIERAHPICPSAQGSVLPTGWWRPSLGWWPRILISSYIYIFGTRAFYWYLGATQLAPPTGLLFPVIHPPETFSPWLLWKTSIRLETQGLAQSVFIIFSISLQSHVEGTGLSHKPQDSLRAHTYSPPETPDYFHGYFQLSSPSGFAVA